MSQTPTTTAPGADLMQRAANIRLACFDVDGTLTDGRLWFDGQGPESKAFHVLDGQGMVLLCKHGIAVAMVTARGGKAAAQRGAELGIEVCSGIGDKLAQVQALCGQHGCGLQQVAFMGDDLPDLRVMKAVGLAVAPANAHRWILPHAHLVTAAAGGAGAARELCDLLLEAQGKAEAVLQGFS